MAERKYHRKIYRKNEFWKNPFFFLRLSGFCFLIFVFGFLILFLVYAKDLPRPEVFSERHLFESSKIYDRTGQVLLYEVYGEEKRTWVPLEKISKNLQQAVIATEDANFYKHFGIDPKGIARAILADLKIGRAAYGGSTLAQQLIRSTFLTNAKNARRKIREIILALELDRRYSKDQILEWYLNQVPFGQNSYGAEAASQTYFGKSSAEISLEEAAILASLIRAPSRMSPYSEDTDELFIRKNYVLERMADEKYITEDRAEETKEKEIKFIGKPVQIKAPYFTLWVKQQLEEKYGQDFIRERGLKIFTTLDWDAQKIAEKATKEGAERNRAHSVYNASLVAINPKNGEILAMTVGSGDYNAKPFPKGCESGKTCLFDPKFNVVVGTKENPGRQPGSAFKPFVYVTAFEKGFDDRYIVQDEPTDFGIWGGENYQPQNYDGKFRGPISLRNSLAQSLNVPSVKVLLDLASIDDSVKTAQNLGITTLTPPFGPSIVLGGWEVKLLEIVSAYGVFATEGSQVDPSAILKIEDQRGNIIFENKKTPKKVVESNAARMINDILSDNEARAPMFGPQSALYFDNYQVAVKTGTTQDYKDAWAIGYTPNLVVGVWAGNNNSAPTAKPGAMLAAPIWREFMEKTLFKFPKTNFNKPNYLTTTPL